MHTVVHTHEQPQDRKIARELLSRLRQNLPSKTSPLNKQAAAIPANAEEAHSSQGNLASAPRPASANVAQTVQNIKLFQLQQPPTNAASPTATGLQPLRSSAKLHEQLRNILAEAEAQPHWHDNPEGFHACLDDVEFLFRKLFSPAPAPAPALATAGGSRHSAAESCAVRPTQDNLDKCINAILPVLLMPKQSPALSISEVAEFLHDMLQMSSKAVFHCVCEMPAILYLDVYSNLLPMYEYLDGLQWDPAIYKHIIVRSARIHCLHPLHPEIVQDLIHTVVGFLTGQLMRNAFCIVVAIAVFACGRLWKRQQDPPTYNYAVIRSAITSSIAAIWHGIMIGNCQCTQECHVEELHLPCAVFSSISLWLLQHGKHC